MDSTPIGGRAEYVRTLYRTTRKVNMQPYTIDDAETDLRAAIDSGDIDRIAAAEAIVDKLDHAKAATSATLHEAALFYISVGLHVFPLQPGSKIPFKGSRGCKDGTTDADQIDRWWKAEPDANIGIATGHLVDVVDIDGIEGVAAIAEQIEGVRGNSVGMVSTPRAGGQHWYVRHVEGRANKAGLIDHVDTRGAGGYVCAPPSQNEQGTYVWIRPLDLGATNA